MKKATCTKKIMLVILSVIALWAGSETLALAAGGDAGWRPVYDNVMMIINFFILVFLLIKLGKTPVSNFIDTKRNEISSELARLENEKDRSSLELEETRAQITDMESHLHKIKMRIIEEGELAKQTMIENARAESEFLVEAAKRRVKSRFVEARRRLKEQMVDMAIDIVAKKLPQTLEEQDHKRQTNLFLESLEKAAEERV
ncbi:MAG: hypothetical protein DRH32_03015 [Deltaproteobacteria bacterium]|nr:MAG: hypothetical protein DRH32_03015 [Deltaproteobacteria bacterium]